MLKTEAGGGELRVLAGATATIGTRIGGTGAPLSLPLPLTMALQLFGACVNRVMAAGGPPGNPAGLHCRPKDSCRRRVDPVGLDLCSSHNAGRLAQMAAGATPPPPPRRRGRSAHPPAPHARPDSRGRLHISATRPHSPQAAIRAVTARLPEYPQCPHARAASGGGLVLGRTVQGCLPRRQSCKPISCRTPRCENQGPDFESSALAGSAVAEQPQMRRDCRSLGILCVEDLIHKWLKPASARDASHP